uniref:Uncharacterized protein n=1 Tax=Caenorhabditis japonica TaxID=281687 RepID=A0A8R1IBL9_CAEJA
MLDGIQVRRLTGPVQKIYTATLKPILDMSRSVFGVIVLLENECPTDFCTCPCSHCIFQDVFIHEVIHNPTTRQIGPIEVSEKQPHIIHDPPSCFTVGHWYLGSKRDLIGRLTHLETISFEQIELRFIAPDMIRPLTTSPIHMCFRSCNSRFTILLAD